MNQSIKQIPENIELQKAKEYYESKNAEIEQMIRQVMQSSPDKEAAAPDSADLDSDSVDSLLKYLIYMVLDSDADKAQESILDLLRTDEALRNQLFGIQSSKQLSKEDATALARLGLKEAQ